ncbi:MAG: hypothetical protein LBS89_08665, partial [Zoogloeaceae bacterium]|nr:hypothetical protein [Zoogloeaceae bacterium]
MPSLACATVPNKRPGALPPPAAARLWRRGRRFFVACSVAACGVAFTVFPPLAAGEPASKKTLNLSPPFGLRQSLPLPVQGTPFDKLRANGFVQEVPKKIVSLDLCTDWMLARYAPPERIAAFSPMHRAYFAPWMPEALRHAPTHTGEAENILRLQPDLVIVGQYNVPLLRAQLQRLGLRVEILPLSTLPDAVPEYERRFLALLGLPPERASLPPT